jgi:hypothetical protein
MKPKRFSIGSMLEPPKNIKIFFFNVLQLLNSQVTK